MSNQPPCAPTAITVGPCPVILISSTPCSESYHAPLPKHDHSCVVLNVRFLFTVQNVLTDCLKFEGPLTITGRLPKTGTTWMKKGKNVTCKHSMPYPYWNPYQ